MPRLEFASAMPPKRAIVFREQLLQLASQFEFLESEREELADEVQRLRAKLSSCPADEDGILKSDEKQDFNNLSKDRKFSVDIDEMESPEQLKARQALELKASADAGSSSKAVEPDAKAPMASVALDINFDGRPDVAVTGVDQNRDGIPDALQDVLKDVLGCSVVPCKDVLKVDDVIGFWRDRSGMFNLW
jgi:hypothetical protein